MVKFKAVRVFIVAAYGTAPGGLGFHDKGCSLILNGLSLCDDAVTVL